MRVKFKGVLVAGVLGVGLLLNQGGAEASNLREESTYGNIYKTLQDIGEGIEYDITELDRDKVTKIVQKVIYDMSDETYLRSWNYSSAGRVQFTYLHGEEEIKERRKVVNETVEGILGGLILGSDTDFEKVKKIHDYVALNTEYKYSTGLADDVRTSYGLVVNGYANCDGYTSTVQHMLDEVGIENEFIIGYNKKGVLHAWNMVKLDGEYYHMDVTGDGLKGTENGRIGYWYFLVSDKSLSKIYEWDKQGYPKAESEKYSYFQDMYSRGIGTTTIEVGNYVYYSNYNYRLYRVTKDGGVKERLGEKRVPYIKVSNGYTYYSNYDGARYLTRMNNNRNKATRGNKKHVNKVYEQKGALY